jgi:hypothetical protein
MFVHEGKAFATWKFKPVKTSTRRIAVSDELAAEVLYAKRGMCSFTGKQPTYSLLPTHGYTCRDKTVGEECSTVEYCTECGYYTRYPGNPRFRAALLDGQVNDDGHPERSRLKALSQQAEFWSADWDDMHKMLVPSMSEGVLKIQASRAWRIEEPKLTAIPA